VTSPMNPSLVAVTVKNIVAKLSVMRYLVGDANLIIARMLLQRTNQEGLTYGRFPMSDKPEVTRTKKAIVTVEIEVSEDFNNWQELQDMVNAALDNIPDEYCPEEVEHITAYFQEWEDEE